MIFKSLCPQKPLHLCHFDIAGRVLQDGSVATLPSAETQIARKTPCLSGQFVLFDNLAIYLLSSVLAIMIFTPSSSIRAAAAVSILSSVMRVSINDMRPRLANEGLPIFEESARR